MASPSAISFAVAYASLSIQQKAFGFPGAPLVVREGHNPCSIIAG